MNFSLALPGGFSAFHIAFLFIYLLPILGIIYWMVKMLKNSNENKKLQQEILSELKKREKNDKDPS